MTDLFLLKLISELLSPDKPTADEIGVAKKILKEMIEVKKMEHIDYTRDARHCNICKGYDCHTQDCPNNKSALDFEAQQAQKELLP